MTRGVVTGSEQQLVIERMGQYEGAGLAACKPLAQSGLHKGLASMAGFVFKTYKLCL